MISKVNSTQESKGTIMKPDLYIKPVDNGYLVKAMHPESGVLVATRIATHASAYSGDSLATACEYLLLMDLKPCANVKTGNDVYLDGDSPDEAINYDQNVDHDAA